MKKAKIMLTAIAVFAVVGGALAFKAKTTPRIWYKNTGNSGPCNVTAALSLSPTVAPAGFYAQLTTIPTTLPCPQRRVTPTAQ